MAAVRKTCGLSSANRTSEAVLSLVRELYAPTKNNDVAGAEHDRSN